MENPLKIATQKDLNVKSIPKRENLGYNENEKSRIQIKRIRKNRHS